MATLVTTSGHLQVEGFVPSAATIDTGKGAVIFVQQIASQLARYESAWLTDIDTVLTAIGTEEQGLGRMISLLSFVLAWVFFQREAITLIADT